MDNVYIPPKTINHPHLYADDPHRILIVDSSAVTRGHFKRILESDICNKVIAVAGTGDHALEHLQNQVIDVILLDPNMLDSTGKLVLPTLMEMAPQVKIILTATALPENAQSSMVALENGTADYITIPPNRNMTDPTFPAELLTKTKALAMVARTSGSRRRLKSVIIKTRTTSPSSISPAPSIPIAIRPQTYRVPHLIAIGASTGGPQAVLNVVSYFKKAKQPIVITQHMPTTFTPILAKHIEKKCGIPCMEGQDGTPLLGGHAYIAPGDFHMTISGSPEAPVISLNQAPPENYCRPSVDPMLRSAARVFGGHVLTLILTGMGQDGLVGCKHVVDAGGMVIAQDEPTSVVWGMPGAVAQAGLCSAILPLEEIGPFVADKIIRIKG